MGVCDSCGEDVDILLPLRIYNEARYGAGMIERWYCVDCWKVVTASLESDEDEFEEEDEDGG